jgi:hypothetical protein
MLVDQRRASRRVAHTRQQLFETRPRGRGEGVAGVLQAVEVQILRPTSVRTLFQMRRKPERRSGPPFGPTKTRPFSPFSANLSSDRLGDQLADYHAYHATRADLLRRLGRSQKLRGLRQSHRTGRRHRRDRPPDAPPRPVGVAPQVITWRSTVRPNLGGLLTLDAVEAGTLSGNPPRGRVLRAAITAVLWLAVFVGPVILNDEVVVPLLQALSGDARGVDLAIGAVWLEV